MSNQVLSAALQELETYYTNNEFQKGIDYLLESREQWQPGQFHELIGSFYMKLENYAAARYHFELALNKGAFTDTLVHNLEYTISQMGLSTTTGGSFLQNITENINSMSVEFWIAISLLLLSFGIWKLRIQIQNKAYSRVIIFTLLASLPQIYYWGFLNQQMYAVVLNETPVHEGPSAVFTVHKTLRAGEKIRISKSDEGWSFVQAPDFYRGWVQSEKLGFVGSL